MPKITKKFLRTYFPRDFLEILKLKICLGKVEEMIFEQAIINNRTLDNISAHSDPYMHRDTVHNILKKIYLRAQIALAIPLEKFVEFLEKI